MSGEERPWGAERGVGRASVARGRPGRATLGHAFERRPQRMGALSHTYWGGRGQVRAARVESLRLGEDSGGQGWGWGEPLRKKIWPGKGTDHARLVTYRKDSGFPSQGGGGL